MRRFLLAGLTALLLWLSPARAQPGPVPPGKQSEPAAQAENQGSALPWVAAALFTIIVLVILCMPSRKSQT